MFIRWCVLINLLLVACEGPAQNPEATDAVEQAPKQAVQSAAKRISVPISAEEDYSFIMIPAGSFKMGRNYKQGLNALMAASKYPPHEGPVHVVTLTRDYYIGEYPVTVSQFCEFLNDTQSAASDCIGYFLGKEHPISIVVEDGAFEPRIGCEDFPIHFASWPGAVKFAAWLDERTDHVIRLPTEAEWEFAARGPEGRVYPWEDTMSAPRNQYVFERRSPDPYWLTMPVGSHPANRTPDGVADMLHGGLEWVSDLYSDYSEDPVIDPTGPDMARQPGAALTYRVIRGSSAPHLYATHRNSHPEGHGAGFRLVLQPSIAE